VGPAQAAPHSDKAHESKPVKAPDPKVEAKVNHIIMMMNKESRPLIEARSGWLREIRDPSAGPTCKESNLNAGDGMGSDWQERIAEYKKQFYAKPKLEVDASVLQMVQALEELQKTTSDANEVLAYRNKDNPDRCTKLKALHPVLLSGWNKYIEGLEAIEPFIETFTDNRDEYDVQAAAKKYGKHYRYHFERLVIVSKRILHSAEGLLRNPNRDTDRIIERLARLTEVIEETKQEMATDNAAKKNDTYPPGLSLLVNDSMPRFQSVVKSYIDVIKDKTKRNNPKALQATWKQFVEAYNGAVDQMNGVGFSKGQK
jgi:hypothetical protein